MFQGFHFPSFSRLPNTSLSLSLSLSLSHLELVESIGVLMLIWMNSYLEQELQRCHNLFKLWTALQKRQFIKEHANSIRAVVENASAELIGALPRLKIVSSFSIVVDKIDLVKCRKKGIMVTYTPDVLIEDIADLSIGLMLAMLRRLCESDWYVRSGKWKKGDYKLTTKVSLLCFHVCSLF